MIKKLLLIIAMIYSCICFHAKDRIDMIKILNIKNDIQSLEKRVSKQIQKDHFLATKRELQQSHIFMLNPNDDLKKEDYLNHSFLYKLRPIYDSSHSKSIIRKKRKYLYAETLISDSTGNLIAKSRSSPTYITYTNNCNDNELMTMFYRKEIDFIFFMNYGKMEPIYIVIKDNNIYVLKSSKEGLVKYSLEEFVDCCYEEWLSLEEMIRRIKPSLPLDL